MPLEWLIQAERELDKALGSLISKVEIQEIARPWSISNAGEFFPCHETVRNPIFRPHPKGAKIRRSSAAERVTVNH